MSDTARLSALEFAIDHARTRLKMAAARGDWDGAASAARDGAAAEAALRAARAAPAADAAVDRDGRVFVRG
jgi:hypothetical protein